MTKNIAVHKNIDIYLLIQRAYYLLAVEFGNATIDESELASLLSCDLSDADFEKWLDEMEQRISFYTWILENQLREIYEREGKSVSFYPNKDTALFIDDTKPKLFIDDTKPNDSDKLITEKTLLNLWYYNGVNLICKYKNRIKWYRGEKLEPIELFNDLSCGNMFKDVLDVASVGADIEDHLYDIKDLLKERI